jgi:transposase InsO family protein
LQKAPGGFSHLLVAIDKLSKWIEVRPLTSIRSKQAVAFFTNIIHRFGVPNSIITDNGTQFTGKKFLDFCEDHHIRVDWAAVAHPMTNGQVERANGMLLQGLKPRIYNDLNKFGKRWMKELPSVVWSLRTMLFEPCFIAEGPARRNSFGKSCLYVMPKLPLMKLRCYSVSKDEGSNRLKDGMTF